MDRIICAIIGHRFYNNKPRAYYWDFTPFCKCCGKTWGTWLHEKNKTIFNRSYR